MKDFDLVLKLLQKYKEQHGDCLVPGWYITEDGIRLGNIVKNIRNGCRTTTAEEEAILDSLGFVWEINESPISFPKIMTLLEEYKEQHGDCLVPFWYITEDEIRLGRIVSSIRCGDRKISVKEKEMLDSIGFVWKAKRGRRN